MTARSPDDNALAEATIGLYKTELVHNRGPWRGLDDLELATLTPPARLSLGWLAQFF